MLALLPLIQPAPRRYLRWLPLTLLLLLTLLSGPLAAQTTAAHRYWEADGDSLRRVLDTQRADTARLRTLLHMFDVGGYRSEADVDSLLQEHLRLLRRLRRPEARAHQLYYAAIQLSKAKADPAAQLKGLRAAVEAFDNVGRPALLPLSGIATLLRSLNQPEAQIAYFQPKLAQYQARGARVNVAQCHFHLGAPFVTQGDYNQGIGHYLRSADLWRPYSRRRQENQLKVVGFFYAEWGNPAKALYFSRQALAVHDALPRRGGHNSSAYTYWGMAQAYRQLRDYPAALRYVDKALAGVPGDTSRAYAGTAPQNQAHGLVVKSAVLLDISRVAEAGTLLARAQHLSDSLKLGISNRPGGIFELDATWARYYAAQGQPARAEQAWLTAYGKARDAKLVPRRLAYLRALSEFYAQRGQDAPAGRYARLGLALSDSLRIQQGAFQVAGYEAERAEQAQQQRIAGLRETQRLDAARARRQRLVLWAVLGGVGLLLVLAAVLYYAFRRSERLKQLVTHQKQDLQGQRDQLDASLTKLQATQAQLIQSANMASLGELTAGIAHEIQNPLNFVNNFADVSAEMMQELQEAQAAGDTEEVAALADDVRQNLGKIHEHGQRAASIVRGMLEHSRQSTGERAPVDVNQLADEYLRLAYQGLRAKDKSFNATLETDFAPGLPPVPAVGADLGRVLLNLLGNAFYAVRQRQQQQDEADFHPTVSLSTKQVNGQVEIRVRDNGPGIPADVQAKIFQPFFTTKPTGEGTGLGLSLSYDIITKGHGGTLTAESPPGQGTTFVIRLPA